MGLRLEPVYSTSEQPCTVRTVPGDRLADAPSGRGPPAWRPTAYVPGGLREFAGRPDWCDTPTGHTVSTRQRSD